MQRMSHNTNACLWPLRVLAGCAVMAAVAASAADIQWQHLTSKNGDLPAPPGGSAQQTGAVVADFDNDGINDFILSFRQKPPALVWYRRTAGGWVPCARKWA